MAEMTLTISAIDKATAVVKGVASGTLSAFNSITGGITALSTAFTALSSIASSVFGAIKSAATTVASGIKNFAMSVIDSGAQWESMSTRMNALTGSAEAGRKAMDFLAERAAKLPYTLNEVIEGASGIKAFGMEIEKWMTPLSDVAAFMGTSLVEAAGAMGRAFSGGAGAADIFRERGILTLMKAKTGIEDLTKLTLPEFQAAMYKTFTDGAAGIAGMSDKLGSTFTGKLSTLTDYWDAFKRKVSEDVFPKIKGALDDLLTKIDTWSKDGSLNQWASLIGTAMATAFEKGKTFVVAIYTKLTEWAKDGSLSAWLNSAAESARSLWNGMIDAVPKVITVVGSLGEMMLDVAAAFADTKASIIAGAIEIVDKLKGTFVGKRLGITEEIGTGWIEDMRKVQAVAYTTADKYREMGSAFKTHSNEIASAVAAMSSSLKADLSKPVTEFDFLKNSIAAVPKDVQVKVTTTYVDVRSSAATSSGTGGETNSYGNWNGSYAASEG